MSAACAPATATSPAAVPRRRLFTIFVISTSISVLGGFDFLGRCSPWKVPLAPLTTPVISRYPSVPLAAGLTELSSDFGNAPPICRRMKLATYAAAHAIMK